MSATLFEAKTHLSALINQVERTREPVVITRHGKPVAKLVPWDPPEADAEAVLAPLRQRAREQGIRYTAEQLTEPIPSEHWGELGAPG